MRRTGKGSRSRRSLHSSNKALRHAARVTIEPLEARTLLSIGVSVSQLLTTNGTAELGVEPPITTDFQEPSEYDAVLLQVGIGFPDENVTYDVVTPFGTMYDVSAWHRDL